MEAVFKILAFTFKAYIANTTNKVNWARCQRGWRHMLQLDKPWSRGAYKRSKMLRPTPLHHVLGPHALPRKVDMMIVVTSAALLAFESAQIEAIKVGCGLKGLRGGTSLRFAI